MSEHWIPVLFTADDTAKRIDRAINIAYQVHLWTLERLSKNYRQHVFVVDAVDFKKNLTQYSKQEKLYRSAQRYTLDQAMLRTIAWWKEEEKYRSWKESFPPEALKADEYSGINIRCRKIWKKYLEEYGQISTVFGMLTLEEGWEKILHQQAKEMKIAPAELPSHWRSLTIRKEDGGYKIKFNG